MIRLLEELRIDIATKETDLPTHVANQIHIGGPGFVVNRTWPFSWGDFVVVNTDGRVSGMTKENIETMRENSKVLNGYYDRLTAVGFADGIEMNIHGYVTGCCKMPNGEHKRKLIKMDDVNHPKSIDFDLVRIIFDFDERKMNLGVDQYEQLRLTPYNTEACDDAEA